MFSLTGTINYPDDECTITWDFNTLDEVLEFIERNITQEPEATSFTFIIVPKR